MKKRLLSAALALAMVLTMLPLSAFAADPPKEGSTVPENGKQTVTYYSTSVAAGEKTSGHGEGWYYSAKDDTDSTITIWHKMTSGVVASTGTNNLTAGTYYDSIDAALQDNKTNIKVIGGTISLDVTKAKSASIRIDVNGVALTVSGTLDPSPEGEGTEATKMTSLTLVNTATADGKVKDAAVTGSITAKNQAFTLTATNISGSLGITLDNSAGSASKVLKVNLTNSTVGAVEVKYGTLDLDVLSKSTTGNVTVNSGLASDMPSFTIGSSDINVNTSSTTGDIAFNAKGAITVNDMSTTGAITLFGGKKVDNKLPTWGGPTVVKVTASSTVTSIGQGTNDGDVSHTISVTRSTVTSGITLDKGTGHTVTVDGSTTSAVTLNGGTLNVQGGSSVSGAVTLGGASNTTATAVTLNMKDDATTVGSIARAASSSTDTLTLNISGGTVSGATALPSDDNVTKNTVTGGTFGKEVPEALLSTSLLYQLKEGTKYTYTSDFQKLIDAYKADPTTAVTTRAAIGASTGTQTITFNDSKGTALVKITGLEGGLIGPLPSKVNTEDVISWVSGATAYTVGSNYLITSDKDQTLTAKMVNSNKIVKITEVSYPITGGTDKSLTATLNGSVITLSGAISNSASLPLTITLTVQMSADDEGTTRTITLSYGTSPSTYLLFNKGANDLVSSGIGFLADSSKSLQVDGTTYTLSYSNLKVQLANVEIDTTTGIKPAATVSDSSLQASEKEALKTALETTVQGTGFVDNDAVVRAANQQINGLSASTVESMLLTAWKAAAKDANDTTNTTNAQLKDAYGGEFKTVTLVPYLNITASKWTKNAAGVDTLTLDIKLYYKYQVTGSISGDSKTYDVGTSGALNVGTDTKGLSITLTLPSGFAGTATTLYIRHSDHVYEGTLKSNELTFTNPDGFSTFVISGVAPTVTVAHTESDNSTTKTYYDSLQAAVDNCKDGDVITLTKDYAGPAAVNVKGETRGFTVVASSLSGAQTLTFNGAKSTLNSTTNTYTVQVENNTAVEPDPTAVAVKVASVANGTARVSTTSAEPGDTVTITLTPNTGYQGTVTVHTDKNTAVPVTNRGNNTFTFTVPANAEEVTVTPVFTVSGLPFVDVPTTADYYDAVKYCYEKGMIEGTTATTFAPNDTITRAQIVTILWRQAGSPGQTPQGIYGDMPANSDYYNAIIWATKVGIAQGYEDGKFYPNRAINRQELATFLYRYEVNYLRHTPTGSVGSLNGYADGSTVPADWALIPMRWAVGNSIIVGNGSVLQPKYDAPRWQAARAMYYYCGGVLGID